MVIEEKNTLLAKLASEIRAIDLKIADLSAERHALTRILERTKSEVFTASGLTRKNSFSKIVVEQEILQTLRRRQVPVSGTDLLAAARTVRYNLKPVTFRTYLHRLKAKGLIINSDEKGRGYWSISPKAPPYR
jgi:predicted transcriptional regulator